MLRGILLGTAVMLSALFAGAPASAKLLRVPDKLPTIQAALDAAKDGDVISVGPGSYCGAIVTKRVTLLGVGRPRIIGCGAGPTVVAGARVGFFLPGVQGVNPANGTAIGGSSFDGRGVSSQNLEPLSFGVFARFANDIVVSNNRFQGTVQAITNAAGDRWRIVNNRITGLTLLDCTSLCTGGDGIVLGLARGATAAPGGDSAAVNRPEDNLVLDNFIEGSAPDGFADFSMVGVLLLAADHTTVLKNELRLRDNPNADAVGQGIVVSNSCCGLPGYLPGSRHTILAFNDGRKSEVAIVVEGSGGVNTEGLFLLKNRGKEQIELVQQKLLAAKAVSTSESSAHVTL